ncbi:protein ZGRF1 isoform X3 [Sus scrofa]|uniref:protein ZGRF1 isoform X3 n=1 Tax=Sus scrofa TaxID=9823 RepID=UPI000A2B87A2|nr:protein ZGRF1 isoform X3 [Sus scrofa]
MESQEFIVLYTHQKMKKSKVWQDGILKITHVGNKAILYDDKGQCLESLFLKCLEVKPGDDLESDRYLITVEEVKVAGSIAVKQDIIKGAPPLNSKSFIPSGRSLGCQPAGLKRKFTGFQGPRQVPKKMAITENSESAASLEAKEAGPVFLSPVYSTPPLFPTVGKKDINYMPTDPDNQDRERNGIAFSSVVSTPSFKINPEMLCEENYFCSTVNSVNKHSGSLLTDELMKRDCLVSHNSGVSQNIRSKAQILALLKSKSTGTSKEPNSEITGHFPLIQPQGSLKIPAKLECLIEQEEHTQVKSTESLYCQHQSKNTMRNKSRWAMYLSSQSSPTHSSTVDGNNTGKNPEAEGGNINLNLKDALVQKSMRFLETCTEEGKKYNEDKPVVDNDQSWNQKVKLEFPSFCESSALPVTCDNVENDSLLSENDSLLSENDIQENNKRLFNQNDQMGIKGSILITEKAQEITMYGTPAKEYKHLQIESSLSNDFRVSNGIADMFSKSNADNENLNSIHEPLVEITFNLNNFETSDSEEESQESSRISHDSEGWVKETLVKDNSSCENINCAEVGSDHLPLLTSSGDRLAETFSMKETLLSQFCDKTSVGFDTGPWKAGNTRKEIEEEYGDTSNNLDSSLEWTEDANVGSNEGTNKSTQEVTVNYDFASLPNESINTNLHIPHSLNTATNQDPENNPWSQQAQPQPFIMGTDLHKNTEQVLPLTSSSGNGTQLLNASQNHSEEFLALDKSHTQVSNSSFYPLGVKYPISKDTESHILESEDLGRTRSLPHDNTDIETARESKQYWNTPKNSSELSGLENSISLLKSLSEHSTALEGLEILKKKHTSFKQQGTLQTYDPESSPEARKPLTTIVSQAIPKSHPNQDPQQMIKENEVKPSESLTKFFPLGSEEETDSRALIPKQMERKTCDPKPVEFQGHQVKGSAASAVMVRGHSSQFECSQFPDSVYENCMTNTCFLTPKLPSTCMQIDFLQLPDEENLIKGDSSFNTEDNFQVIAEPNKNSVKNDLMKKSLENKNLQRLSLEISDCELCFPSGEKVKSAYLPQRQIHIPAVFQSPAHYKQIFTSCLIEHLNILLFGLAQRLHKALSKVDISFYSSNGDKRKNVENNVPSCHHHHPAKLVMVKKEGPNKGRLFYACDGPKADQCKFFKWLDEVTPGYLTQEESLPSMVLSDIKSIGLYLRSQKIPLYEECQLLVRKGFDFQRKRYGKLKKFTTVDPEFYNEPKSRLYLKLSRKESSSAYSKDDLWVVSKTLDFELDTFIACSTFFGPSSVNEVELLPLKGYFPSNWPTNTLVHALLVCNASTELTTLKNIQDYFNPATLPLTQNLLTMSSSTIVSNKRVNKRKFIPPAFSNINTKFELLSIGATLQLAGELIHTHKLNKDQATALIQIAQMMASQGSAEEVKELGTHTLPITIIHGVFGAGKSYLLAVVILFFVQLFEKSEALAVGNGRPWKLLISSSTNVAVDRVLLGLLSLGFEKFVRVGSVRKIAKPILPYSLHAGSENENEQLKELHTLMKEDLTPVERVYVRKSIEQHKLGTNKTLLKQVRVVGVTCAACPFPCMNDLKFPVVVLDECSQITEPASLLPIARFECEKLILVGDPKQLPPTIQGSDAAHENGLEQTLFDRLCLMGHKPVLLRTQYRCHPTISAIANDLFYEGNLVNGVSETERSPLLEWLPTLCFYNIQGLEQIERDNSFHNVAEAAFTLKLIQSLIVSGIAGSMIGVITLYKSQMYKLCHLLTALDFDHPGNVKAVQVSTVDAFQGAEKEIIILSCVRTRQVGFIDSEQRMNVALTRGRRHLLIVGNLACLRKNRLWGRVIQHCEGREDGLQHASQYEPQLNHLLKDYFEKQAEEKQKKKNEKDKSKDKSHLQKETV